MNMTKKPKEDISKLLSTKGFNNVHSKSVNKNKTNQKHIKEKNISLEKHQNRELVTKTQTGFYILTGGGVIQEKEEEHFNPSTHYSKNKIYNAKHSPKSRNNQRTKNVALNTEEIVE